LDLGFEIKMRTWLVELAAAAGLFVVAVTVPMPALLALLCVAGAVVLGALSTANLFGIEFLVRRRAKNSEISDGSAPRPLVPVTGLVPLPAPQLAPLAAPRGDRGPPLVEGEFTDASPQELVRLASTPDLTRAQIDRLLEPHLGKWLAIDGTVEDVGGRPTFASLELKDVNGDARLMATAYFNKKDGAEAFGRAMALHKGAQVRVRGRIERIGRSGITLDPCEFID
jgi:hypothetical protein